MNYNEILINLFDEAKTNTNIITNLKKDTLNNINILAKKCFEQKGVFTVFITLAIYKIKHPEQDIRCHQTQIQNGFSGRTIDTHFITPTLKKLGLPSMAESGWLTRSLEQPYPYNLYYNGKIGNKNVKKAFLELINDIQENNIEPKSIIIELLKEVINIQEKNIITISPLKNPEKLTINKIISVLEEQFSFNYGTFGGSKLPVLAFYAIYEILICEMNRYQDCVLKNLGSHTSSDRTSGSAGDIEIFKGKNLFEAIEIKLDKQIDSNMLRIAKDKIIKYNPQRYYILSYIGQNTEEIVEIENIVNEVKDEHGCQIVVNGVMPSLKYYLRLINKLDLFINKYSKLIEIDRELKVIHKKKWEELTRELN